jgi:hypothetical protein
VQLVRLGAPLLSISSGIEMADVQKAELELQQEDAVHKQQQQQERNASWPGSPPSGRLSASGVAAPPNSRVASFKGYGGSGHSLRQQQQQLGRLPQLRIAPHASSVDAGAAQSATFTVANAPRAPIQVEVHRLGLFAFKGGPPQQEMVQIIASNLLGRLDITARAAVVPSRKGQLLQQQEGRIGEPVTVQLPTLAQEYKAQLPERLLTSPTRFPLSRGRAYIVTDRQGTGGILHSSDDGFSLPATNSAPVEGSEQQQQQQQQQQHHVRWDSASLEGASGAAAAAAAAAAVVGQRSSSGSGEGSAATTKVPPLLASMRVMSDITSRASASPLAVGNAGSSSDAAGRSSSGSDVAASAAVSAPLPRLSEGWQPSSNSKRGSSSGGGGNPVAAAAAPAVDRQIGKSSSDHTGHLTLTVHGADAAAVSDVSRAASTQSYKTAEGLASAPECTAAAASFSSGGGSGGHSGSMLLRHDSFRSVASVDAALEEDVAAADVAACRSSKSGSSIVHSPRMGAGQQQQQLLAAGCDEVLQQDVQQLQQQRQRQQE